MKEGPTRTRTRTAAWMHIALSHLSLVGVGVMHKDSKFRLLMLVGQKNREDSKLRRRLESSAATNSVRVVDFPKKR